MLIVLVVTEAGVPVAIVALLARRHIPLWAKWLLGWTLYLAYGALASFLVAPLPSSLIMSAGAAYVDTAYLRQRGAEHGVIGLLLVLGFGWLGLAVAPAAVLFVGGLVVRLARGGGALRRR